MRVIAWSSHEAANEVFAAELWTLVLILQVDDMLREWAALSPDDALDLLDAGFAHSV